MKYFVISKAMPEARSTRNFCELRSFFSSPIEGRIGELLYLRVKIGTARIALITPAEPDHNPNLSVEVQIMAVSDFTPEEIQTEEWRSVVGYEGFYEVSNLGRVKKCFRGYPAEHYHRVRFCETMPSRP